MTGNTIVALFLVLFLLSLVVRYDRWMRGMYEPRTFMLAEAITFEQLYVALMEAGDEMTNSPLHNQQCLSHDMMLGSCCLEKKDMMFQLASLVATKLKITTRTEHK